MPLIHALARARFLEEGPFPQALHVGERQALMLLCLQHEQRLQAPPDDAAETSFLVLDGAGFVEEGDERHAVERGDVIHVGPGTAKALVAGAGTFTVLGVRALARRDAAAEAPARDEGRSSMFDTTIDTVDVRTIAPRDRHPLLFEKFDALASGDAYELVNDHDPKPLYYQFQAERPGQLDWNYLEEGPEVWRVRIGKV